MGINISKSSAEEASISWRVARNPLEFQGRRGRGQGRFRVRRNIEIPQETNTDVNLKSYPTSWRFVKARNCPEAPAYSSETKDTHDKTPGVNEIPIPQQHPSDEPLAYGQMDRDHYSVPIDQVTNRSSTEGISLEEFKQPSSSRKQERIFTPYVTVMSMKIVRETLV